MAKKSTSTPTLAPETTRDSRVVPGLFVFISVIFIGAIALVTGVVVLFSILGVDPFTGF